MPGCPGQDTKTCATKRKLVHFVTTGNHEAVSTTSGIAIDTKATCITLIGCITAVFYAVFASNACATVDIRSSPENQLDFSLIVQQNNLSLQNSRTTLDTDVLGFGFQMIDIPPDLPIQLGVGLGYAFMDQQTYPGLNNASMGGLYFSLLARTRLFAAGSWSSEAVFAYDYLRVEKNGETQQSRLHWSHVSAEAYLNYFLTDYLSMDLGAKYGQLNAKLSGSGDNNVSESLDSDGYLAGLVGLNYHLPGNQKVAIIGQQGYINRIMIQFQRTFD
jgi:hypothetical protein